jgi:enamine deaminase RidA (YjgF/YER057c/UK114 family)
MPRLSHGDTHRMPRLSHGDTQMNAEQRVRELRIDLPAPPAVAGNYVPGVRVGDLVFMSGSVSRRSDGTYIVGKVGSELTVDEGYAAARGAGMFMLSRIRSVVGSLNNVLRVVKVLGMVNAVPDFKEHPKVIDGFSDLLVEVFGDSGRGARAAVGMMSLSKQVAVEVEMVLEAK